MNIQILKKLIDKAVETSKIPEEAIIDDLAQIVQLKYGVFLLEKERSLVDELKTKIITRLYNLEHQTLTLNKMPKEQAYKADNLEIQYLEKAESELEAESIITRNDKQVVLTSVGILKYKEFYAEI